MLICLKKFIDLVVRVLHLENREIGKQILNEGVPLTGVTKVWPSVSCVFDPACINDVYTRYVTTSFDML